MIPDIKFNELLLNHSYKFSRKQQYFKNKMQEKEKMNSKWKDELSHKISKIFE